MLIQIGKQSKPSEDQSAIDALLECHERIRYFMRLAHGIVESNASDAEIASAAGEVHRYFSVALPLHSADEDASLLPRVSAHDSLRDALSQMETQHIEIEAVLDELRPIWSAIADDPVVRDGESELRSLTSRLQALWDSHLQLEEALIFPTASELLTTAEHAAIREEMRLRRAA